MTLKMKWEKTGLSVNLRKNKDGYGVYNPSTQEDYQEFQTGIPSDFQISLDYSKKETVSKILIITLVINTQKPFSFCDIYKKIN